MLLERLDLTDRSARPRPADHGIASRRAEGARRPGDEGARGAATTRSPARSTSRQSAPARPTSRPWTPIRPWPRRVSTARCSRSSRPSSSRQLKQLQAEMKARAEKMRETGQHGQRPGAAADSDKQRCTEIHGAAAEVTVSVRSRVLGYVGALRGVLHGEPSPQRRCGWPRCRSGRAVPRACRCAGSRGPQCGARECPPRSTAADTASPIPPAA